MTESLKALGFKAFIVFFSLCTLLWLSIILYGLLYYLYIPAIAHIKSIHFKYDMSCAREKQCYPKFPFDNITLIESGNEFLRGGQGYAVELVLEMPESERNWIQGIFMIKLDMLTYEGRLIKSTSRAAMLHYRSPLFKIFYTIFFMPGLLAGSFEEKQSLVIPLFENYIEDSYNAAHFAHIEIQARTVELYSSSLRIHAQFTGLRYLMYYWPVTSAIIGIGGHFLFLVLTISLIWVYESTKTSSNEINIGQSHSTIRLQPRNEGRDGFQNDRLLQRKTHDPMSERGNIEEENENTHRENENRNLVMDNEKLENEETEMVSGRQDMPNDEIPQMEPGINRYEMDIENVPRHRLLQ